mmetsp:Transcript_4784/g.6671  ORF Transcript_4784/g.6671 Transcript_4784/m.6671 type:complete len:318 (-) Transcript_4784:1174-2127(-)|eukprot:CAMPEP_0194034538 /NCGR_PEP_ID=MMETSP0009_2-20130614/6951_1 /TAXON_ID=210454 /ORGANISM="Grammatophora oceanica, Strain CCMP 410" /LENGTH=317 /DNA_ID=CAMNT_0038675501 /DNA_START=249 /DNA_END=1202 /DNA_ORIENTATION=+
MGKKAEQSTEHNIVRGQVSKRETKNQREKERASRITQQINTLKDVLVGSGIVGERATKNSVLSEAVKYIRSLQEEKRRMEMQQQQQILQCMRAPAVTLGHSAERVTTLRPVVAPQPWDGRASSANMAGSAITTTTSAVQPLNKILAEASATAALESSMAVAQMTPDSAAAIRGLVVSSTLAHQRSVSPNDYILAFESCPLPMAIANVSGKFLACNKLFRQTAGHTEEGLLSMTFFNLTHQQDLRVAFEAMSRMIAAPLLSLGVAAGTQSSSDTFTVKSTMVAPSTMIEKNLRIDAVKTEQGALRCLRIIVIDAGGAG